MGARKIPRKSVPVVNGLYLTSSTKYREFIVDQRLDNFAHSGHARKLSHPYDSATPYFYQARRSRDHYGLTAVKGDRPLLEAARRRTVSMEQRRSKRAGETGDPRENPPASGIVRHGSHLRKSEVNRLGIEPSSPWGEANCLTAQPPWPCHPCVVTRLRRLNKEVSSTGKAEIRWIWRSGGMQGRGNGSTQRKPTGQYKRPPRFPKANIQVIPPGIELDLPLCRGEPSDFSRNQKGGCCKRGLPFRTVVSRNPHYQPENQGGLQQLTRMALLSGRQGLSPRDVDREGRPQKFPVPSGAGVTSVLPTISMQAWHAPSTRPLSNQREHGRATNHRTGSVLHKRGGGFDVKRWGEEIWAALNSEQHRNERAWETGDPEKTRRTKASSGKTPTCENSGVSRQVIEPGSPWWGV
ncbi:hypothetical protein PR048_019819 [Dryococelus australis]|uniref:Uncharacterized protein n=1 Tax=Dryococelus australis TaxID=614101 RepID=A0ABQ9H4I7_9NEOP|nr:hypothetical protein PR048_019819 [Dryococelus australis]